MHKVFRLKLTVVSLLVLSLSVLSGCTSELFSPMPQKVTIEKTEASSSAEVTASPTPTPTPMPTDAPIEQAPLNSYGIDESAENSGLNSQKRKQVVADANDLLDHGFYSRDSLIYDLMQKKGYNQEEAEYGADHCYVEWY